MVQYNI